ncbi:MAG: hypothetical protein LC114_01810 [Bryobacterales bacterium]|nr:hypothetical protein [Bryobacterales bacterium]
MQATKVQATATHELPPLILHPLADEGSPESMLEGSRANLMLHGLLPHDTQSDEELVEKVARSRYLELRMLFFVGKDLERWLQQCAEFVDNDRELVGENYTQQSFASYLIESTPTGVRNKLLSWGVVDYRNIFVRALGLRSVFQEFPPFDVVSRTFLLDYHRFTDYLYACRQQLSPFTPIAVNAFSFEIYASSEYSQILEKQWNEAGI